MDDFLKWVPLVQAGSSIFLGVAGFALAIVTAYWSYRNNFGWEPIVILGRLGLQGTYVIDQLGNINPPNGQPRYQVRISIEVWNRRKYPVVVRKMVLVASRLDIVQEVGPVEGGWNYYKGRYASMYGNSIAASSSDTQTLTIPFNVGDPSKVRSPLVVTVDFYDPRLNRVFSITGAEIYTIKGGLPLLPSSSNPQPELNGQ